MNRGKSKDESFFVGSIILNYTTYVILSAAKNLVISVIKNLLALKRKEIINPQKSYNEGN